ncbi:ATP-binding protein [Actomonas aquatica]|uniref:histidine kinase n=1 Tax=Actomonas aquatica TaxID=2866162 RepID=A0ABZ1C338_9BACT|nr:ATP-binding protein [Opitutus sp. WL0086]WRQ85775.1 ATP-binding protein [Opitutus sp. WL0086]
MIAVSSTPARHILAAFTTLRPRVRWQCWRRRRTLHHLRVALACTGLLAVTASGVLGWDHPQEGQLLSRRISISNYGGQGAAWAVAQVPTGEFFVGADRIYVVRGTYRYAPIEGIPGRNFRAVTADQNGRVWIGGWDELGYIEADETGEFVYTSLTAEFNAASEGNRLGQVIAAEAHSSGALFITEQGAHWWNGSRFQSWTLADDAPLNALRPQLDTLWVHRPEMGIIAFARSGPRLISPQSQLPGAPVWMLAPPETDGLSRPDGKWRDGWMLGTADAVFVHRDAAWHLLPELSAELRGARPTAAVRLNDSTIAISSQQKGVLVVDPEGHVLNRIEGDPTLGDNQVLSLWLDHTDTLWAGTALGWTEIVSPREISTLWPLDEKRSNTIRSLTYVGAELFAASSRGVYRLQPGIGSDGRARLLPLPATPGPTWTLSAHGDELYAGGVGGLWRLVAGSWQIAKETAGDVLVSLASQHHPGLIFHSNGTRIESYAPTGATAHTIELGEIPAEMIEGPDGNLWISTTLGTLWQMQPTAAGFTVVAEYRPGAGLPTGTTRASPGAVGEEIAVFTDEAILALDGDAFRPIPAFHGLSVSSISPRQSNGKAYWLMGRRHSPTSRYTFLAEASHNARNGWQIEVLTGDRLYSSASTQALLPSRDGAALWFGSTSNLIRLGPDSLRPRPPPGIPRFTSVLANVPVPESDIEPSETTPANNERIPTEEIHFPLTPSDTPIPDEAQSLRFTFSTGSDVRDGLFQTQLGGLETEWQGPTSYSREFTGLAAGDYEFRVRTIDRAGRIGPTITYPFTKQAPWYGRWPARIGYVFIALALFALGLRWRLRNLQRKNEQLNLIVEERTRELAMANSAKMEFLASISHEIRNPLNGITGLVGLLSDAPLAPRERELARSLSACARSLRRVFDEVLGFARLEEGRVTVRDQPFRLAPLLREIAQVFSAEATQRGNRIAVAADDDSPAFLGDPEKIRTVISNFVANALKYAPGTLIEINAQIDPMSPNHSAVSLQVTDHGPGIPAAEQELIFKKFVRGSGADLHRETGAGLGLATCQALASLMGGGVGVESEPGQGTTFYLQLTLTHAAREAIEQLAEAASTQDLVENPGPPSQKRRALVIEDQEYNQLVARSILERIGYNVTMASNSDEAHTAIEAGGYSLALVDWDVPGAKGDELAPLIRATPSGQQVAILAVTAHDAEEIRERCLNAGMDGFLVKPLDETLLLHTLRSLHERGRQMTTPTPASSGPADFRVFEYLGRGDEVQARSAAQDYLAQLDSELDGLRSSAATGNTANISARAHRLRAHAAVVQFAALKDTARKLQECAVRQQSEELKPLLRDVETHGEHLRRMIERYLARTTVTSSANTPKT